MIFIVCQVLLVKTWKPWTQWMVLPVAVEAIKWEQQEREKEEGRDKGRSEKLSDEIKTVSHSISNCALWSSYSHVLLSPSSVFKLVLCPYG